MRCLEHSHLSIRHEENTKAARLGGVVTSHQRQNCWSACRRREISNK